MSLEWETKWLKFILKKMNLKTEVYEVISKCDGSVLGEVKWYPKWRYYVFDDGTNVYSDRCLYSLHRFVGRCNAFHSLKQKEPNK